MVFSIAIILFCMLSVPVLAQNDGRKLVQFSGIVVGDEGYGLPGVHVYVPSAGRGTSTTMNGYFSMPALEGDSVLFTSIGYSRVFMIIPSPEQGDHVNIALQMKTDTTYLDNIDITPYLSEELFKETILTMEIPDQQEVLQNRLDGASLALMIQATPYDGALNARYFLDQQIQYQMDKYGPRSNPLLNPFNWAKFIQSLKK